MERYYVEIHADGTKNVISSDKDIVEYQDIQDAMASLPNPYEWFELVTFNVGQCRYIMVLDESGKINGSPINFIASTLYNGFPMDAICGDVIIYADHGDEDMYYMTEEEKDVLELERI